MKMEQHVDQLASAILDQANRLAEQYRLQAQDNRERILREAREKLRLREEREVLMAKSLADRAYRRRVQSQELKLQARLDQLRWSLVANGLEHMRERLAELVRDEGRYLPILQNFLVAGVREMDSPEVLVYVNDADRTRLATDWAGFCGPCADRARLADTTIGCLGGMLLQTPDRRKRLDQTFEGRIRRLQIPLAELIQARMLPAGAKDVAALV